MKKVLLAAVAIALATVSAHADGRSFTISGDSLVSILIGNTIKTSTTSSNLNGQALRFEGGLNMGTFEFGPILSYNNRDNGTSVVKSTGLGAYGRYNFVDNKAGVAVVPFAQLKLESITKKDAGVSTDANAFLLSGGATFFPINDVIGINAQLYYQNSKETVSSLDTTTTGFGLGTSFSLYF